MDLNVTLKIIELSLTEVNEIISFKKAWQYYCRVQMRVKSFIN